MHGPRLANPSGETEGIRATAVDGGPSDLGEPLPVGTG